MTPVLFLPQRPNTYNVTPARGARFSCPQERHGREVETGCYDSCSARGYANVVVESSDLFQIHTFQTAKGTQVVPYHAENMPRAENQRAYKSLSTKEQIMYPRYDPSRQ